MKEVVAEPRNLNPRKITAEPEKFGASRLKVTPKQYEAPAALEKAPENFPPS